MPKRNKSYANNYVQQYKYKIIVEDRPDEEFVRYIPMNAVCIENTGRIIPDDHGLQWTLIPGCNAYCKP